MTCAQCITAEYGLWSPRRNGADTVAVSLLLWNDPPWFAPSEKILTLNRFTPRSSRSFSSRWERLWWIVSLFFPPTGVFKLVHSPSGLMEYVVIHNCLLCLIRVYPAVSRDNPTPGQPWQFLYGSSLTNVWSSGVTFFTRSSRRVLCAYPHVCWYMTLWCVCVVHNPYVLALYLMYCYSYIQRRWPVP